VHATLAGVALALAIPIGRRDDDRAAAPAGARIARLGVVRNPSGFRARQCRHRADRGDAGDVIRSIPLGIAAGLVVGKPLGVMLASVAAVRLRIAGLPAGIEWNQVSAWH